MVLDERRERIHRQHDLLSLHHRFRGDFLFPIFVACECTDDELCEFDDGRLERVCNGVVEVDEGPV